MSGWAKQRGNLGGSFTITAVEAGRRWVSECPLLLGKVVFDHELEPVARGRVRVVKRVEAEGGIAPLIRLFVPRMRRDIAESLAALGTPCGRGAPWPGQQQVIARQPDRGGYSALLPCQHGRGTGRGPGASEPVGIQGIVSGSEGPSVQPGRLGRGTVLMVRRRSTVRFRKGARNRRSRA